MIDKRLLSRDLATLVWSSVDNKLANLFNKMHEVISITSITTSVYTRIEREVDRSVSCNPISEEVFKFTCHAKST